MVCTTLNVQAPPECTVHIDCPAGYGCVGGKCVPATQVPCTIDAQCPSGYKCGVAGYCVKVEKPFQWMALLVPVVGIALFAMMSEKR